MCTGGLSWRTAEIYGVDNFCALLGLVAAAWEEEEEEEEEGKYKAPLARRPTDLHDFSESPFFPLYCSADGAGSAAAARPLCCC